MVKCPNLQHFFQKIKKLKYFSSTKKSVSNSNKKRIRNEIRKDEPQTDSIQTATTYGTD